MNTAKHTRTDRAQSHTRNKATVQLYLPNSPKATYVARSVRYSVLRHAPAIRESVRDPNATQQGKRSERVSKTMKKFTYKKYSGEDQRALATWAADCAERVLPFFVKACSKDARPRKAIETCRTWVRTGVFKMAEIRGASLAAHAAAREAKENNAACFAARAAGQAVATAHVPQHAFGAAYYALKAIAAADPVHAEVQVTKEQNWQARHTPTNLRQEVLKRVIVQKHDDKIFIKIQKGKGF